MEHLPEDFEDHQPSVLLGICTTEATQVQSEHLAHLIKDPNRESASAHPRSADQTAKEARGPR